MWESGKRSAFSEAPRAVFSINPLDNSRQSLNSIERVVEEAAPAQPRRRLRLERGLIRPVGRRIELTNDSIYDLIEFP